MILGIDGSDIRRIGLFSYTRELDHASWGCARSVVVSASPEDFLRAVVAFVDNAEVEGILVVQGPGSANALRASLAIANTLAWAKGIPLGAVGAGQPMEDALAADGVRSPVQYVLPDYTAEPRITISHRDTLRRSDGAHAV